MDTITNFAKSETPQQFVDSIQSILDIDQQKYRTEQVRDIFVSKRSIIEEAVSKLEKEEADENEASLKLITICGDFVLWFIPRDAPDEAEKRLLFHTVDVSKIFVELLLPHAHRSQTAIYSIVRAVCRLIYEFHSGSHLFYSKKVIDQLKNILLAATTLESIQWSAVSLSNIGCDDDACKKFIATEEILLTALRCIPKAKSDQSVFWVMSIVYNSLLQCPEVAGEAFKNLVDDDIRSIVAAYEYAEQDETVARASYLMSFVIGENPVLLRRFYAILNEPRFVKYTHRCMVKSDLDKYFLGKVRPVTREEGMKQLTEQLSRTQLYSLNRIPILCYLDMSLSTLEKVDQILVHSNTNNQNQNETRREDDHFTNHFNSWFCTDLEKATEDFLSEKMCDFLVFVFLGRTSGVEAIIALRGICAIVQNFDTEDFEDKEGREQLAYFSNSEAIMSVILDKLVEETNDAVDSGLGGTFVFQFRQFFENIFEAFSNSYELETNVCMEFLTSHQSLDKFKIACEKTNAQKDIIKNIVKKLTKTMNMQDVSEDW